MKLHHHALIITILTLLVLTSTGCFQHYYSTNAMTPTIATDVSFLQNKDKEARMIRE